MTLNLETFSKFTFILIYYACTLEQYCKYLVSHLYCLGVHFYGNNNCCLICWLRKGVKCIFFVYFLIQFFVNQVDWRVWKQTYLQTLRHTLLCVLCGLLWEWTGNFRLNPGKILNKEFTVKKQKKNTKIIYSMDYHCLLWLHIQKHIQNVFCSQWW